MNCINITNTIKAAVYLATALMMWAGPSHAAVNLMAVNGSWTAADGTNVPMWGFATDTAGRCPGSPVTWTVGPEITAGDLDGDTLIINLRNCLSQPVSIMIPGLTSANLAPVTMTDAEGRQRITAFTHETPADGGTATVAYTWINIPTTATSYIYMSGTHPALQVHMGLYGAVKLGVYPDDTGAAGATLPNQALLYSEIDPALHASISPATPKGSDSAVSPYGGYSPRYFLVNGKEEFSFDVDASKQTVLSFFNAGLEFHVPTLNHSYMMLDGEDGNQYPFQKQQYSVNLPAGKTIDAFWQPLVNGPYALFDRHGNNMVVKVGVTGATGGGGGTPAPNQAPQAVADSYTVDANQPLDIIASAGVLANDHDIDGDPLQVDVASSTLPGLQPDGSIIWTSPASGIYNYTVCDRDLGVAGRLCDNTGEITVTVNSSPANVAPVAVDDSATVLMNNSITIDVAANDTDADGNLDPATVAIVSTPSRRGEAVSNGDGTVTYTPPPRRNWRGTDTFTYTVMDSAGATSNEATVRVNVVRSL